MECVLALGHPFDDGLDIDHAAPPGQPLINSGIGPDRPTGTERSSGSRTLGSGQTGTFIHLETAPE
ncbi:hypothetical protein ACWDZ8_41915, partial [Streptomyces sp. NPDC003233]